MMNEFGNKNPSSASFSPCLLLSPFLGSQWMTERMFEDKLMPPSCYFVCLLFSFLPLIPMQPQSPMLTSSLCLLIKPSCTILALSCSLHSAFSQPLASYSANSPAILRVLIYLHSLDDNSAPPVPVPGSWVTNFFSDSFREELLSTTAHAITTDVSRSSHCKHCATIKNSCLSCGDPHVQFTSIASTSPAPLDKFPFSVVNLNCTDPATGVANPHLRVSPAHHMFDKMLIPFKTVFLRVSIRKLFLELQAFKQSTLPHTTTIGATSASFI